MVELVGGIEGCITHEQQHSCHFNLHVIIRVNLHTVGGGHWVKVGQVLFSYDDTLKFACALIIMTTDQYMHLCY